MAFDPFHAQACFAWRNRWARWRREGAQTAVHAVAVFALALLLGVPAWQSRADWGGALAGSLLQWPVPVGLAAIAMMTARIVAIWRASHSAARRDWLAALPVAASLRRRRMQVVVLREAAGFAALGGAALSVADVGANAFAMFGLAIVAALVLATCVVSLRHRRGPPHRNAPHSAGELAAPARDRAETGRREAWSSVVADRGAGRLWRWQRLACGVALHGRTLAWGALAWLLVPMGSGIGVAFVAGVAGISLALLAGAWRRSLAVLPQAQRWLAVQPLAPAGLLRATWAVPAFVLSLAIAAFAGTLLILGTPGLALFAALASFGFGALQYAATAAERSRPARIPLVFLVHAALLIGVLQAFAIAALPLWVIQMILLLRRAAR